MNRLFRFGRTTEEADTGAESRVAAESAAGRKLGLLQASDLFHGLDDEQMAHVEKMTVMTRCQRGRLVYAAGQPGEALFLLKKGKVHLYRITPDGRKLITAVITPGTLFGNMAFTATTLADSFAEAVEDSVLCAMSRHDLEELIKKYPSISLRLLNIVSRRVLELEARLEEGLLRDMQARVAAALLRLREDQGSDEVLVTHQELADSLGTYRETVTHTLGNLQARGLVSLERSRIRILGEQGLREIVASEAGRRASH